jgi:type IV secretory pathway VirB10-like protein
MNTRILAVLLAAGCVTAAAGGAYLGVRHNGAAPQPAAATPAPDAPASKPVAETEAVVDSGRPDTVAVPDPARTPLAGEKVVKTPAVPARPEARAARAAGAEVPRPAAAGRPADAQRGANAQRGATTDTPAPSSRPAAPVSTPAEHSAAEPPASVPATEQAQERVAEPREATRELQFDEVVLPASSVLGLQVETPLSSERTRIEDRVEARVTRDVTAGGRLAVPAGSRVLGSVTEVDRGGKMKDRARLGVRFHTLVLADGRQVPLHTETILREGDSPSNESARKIGGAAIGGAILGAILGGGKGAVMGGAAGAAGGSAAVVAGDRNAATLPAGTVVSVRLSAPVTIEIERSPQ